MDDAEPTAITDLLRRARDDRASALEELLPLVHAELRRIAGAQMRRERRDHTLEPTALVNEAYVRMVGQNRVDWTDRAEFLAAAAQAMRRVLLDHERAKRARKRGDGALRVTLHEDVAVTGDDAIDVLDLHEHLERFRQLQERQARVVELRFFGGLTFEECAHVLGVSPKTVEADWYFARTWLRREMKAGQRPNPEQ